MSLTIQASPTLFGWAKNRNQLKLLCSGNQQSAGWCAAFSWTFGTLGSNGSHIVVVLDGLEMVFTIGSGTDAYRVSSIAALASKLAANYYITEIFTTTYTSTTLTLYGREVGKHSVEIYCTNSAGVRNGGEDSLIVSSSSNTGGNKTNKPNYAVLAEVEAVANNYNELLEYVSDKMVFSPNSANSVIVPLDVLGGYVPQPDLPANMATRWQILTNALMKYRVRYGEMWGEDTPLVQSMTTTDWFYALGGEMIERYAQINLPDWNSGQNMTLVNNTNIFWVIGEDTAMTTVVRQSQPVFLYGLFYNPNVEIGEAISAAGSGYEVEVTLYGVKEDGTTVSDAHTYDPLNGQVYRMSIGPSLLSDDLLWYSVTVKNNSGEWSRTYLVKPNYYKQSVFLLQNRYGLLIPFVCGQVRRTLETEGEEMTMERRRYIDYTARNDKYVAEMQHMTEEDAKALGRCLGNQYHYIQLQGRWERITIEPGSFAMTDGAENMVEVSFEFRFVDNQQENIGSGPMSLAVTIGVDDVHEHVVSFGEITEPISNELWQQ